MKTEQEPRLSSRMQRAIEQLKGLVHERYPDATFRIRRSPEEWRSIDLVTTVDVPDTTEVVDAVLDRVLELQLKDKLRIHVVPVRPRARVLSMLREQVEQERHPRSGLNP
jgi:hypothetical protein